jgi:hypothetical protein
VITSTEVVVLSVEFTMQFNEIYFIGTVNLLRDTKRIYSENRRRKYFSQRAKCQSYNSTEAVDHEH